MSQKSEGKKSPLQTIETHEIVNFNEQAPEDPKEVEIKT